MTRAGIEPAFTVLGKLANALNAFTQLLTLLIFYVSGFAINNGFPFPKHFHQNPNDAFTQMNDIDPMEVEWTQKNDPSEFENLKHAEEKKS